MRTLFAGVALLIATAATAWGQDALYGAADTVSAGPSLSHPQPAAPSLSDQMFQPRGSSLDPLPAADPSSNCSQSFDSGPGGAACNSCSLGDCCATPWYASVHAIYMTRNDPNHLFFSSSAATPSTLYLDQAAVTDWRWGGELRVGRWFGCETWAVEGVYWTLDPTGLSNSVSSLAGDLNSTFNSSGLTLPGPAGPTSLQSFFNGAIFQQLYRRDELHNAEVNVLRKFSAATCEHPWEFSGLLGFRFFRFDDTLGFSSVPSGTVNPTLTAVMYDRSINDLYGAQIGLDSSYYVMPTLRAFLNTRLGMFANHMTSDFDIYNTYGGQVNHGTPTNPAFAPYPVHATADNVAFMGQFNAGLDWAVTRNWSAQIGYRVVVASGLALADNQFPNTLANSTLLGNINTNSELLLHGGFAGVTYKF